MTFLPFLISPNDISLRKWCGYIWDVAQAFFSSYSSATKPSNRIPLQTSPLSHFCFYHDLSAAPMSVSFGSSISLSDLEASTSDKGGCRLSPGRSPARHLEPSLDGTWVVDRITHGLPTWCFLPFAPFCRLLPPAAMPVN